MIPPYLLNCIKCGVRVEKYQKISNPVCFDCKQERQRAQYKKGEKEKSHLCPHCGIKILPYWKYCDKKLCRSKRQKRYNQKYKAKLLEKKLGGWLN